MEGLGLGLLPLPGYLTPHCLEHLQKMGGSTGQHGWQGNVPRGTQGREGGLGSAGLPKDQHPAGPPQTRKKTATAQSSQTASTGTQGSSYF